MTDRTASAPVAAATVSSNIARTTCSRTSGGNKLDSRLLAADNRLRAMITPTSAVIASLMGAILPAAGVKFELGNGAGLAQGRREETR